MTGDSMTPHHKPTVERARQQLSTGHDVASVTDPFAAQSAAISADGQTGYFDVSYTLDKLTTRQLTDATTVADGVRAAGVQIEFTGLLAQLAKNDPASELIGIGVAIVVLLIAFGSVVAMGLPPADPINIVPAA